MQRPTFQHTVLFFFGFIFLILLYQAVRTPKVPEKAAQQLADDCKGDPIFVDYPYNYTVAQPHACKPQCADDKLRYVVYSNGLGTQCEIPPGCNDYGEDQGVTCRVPPGVGSEKSS